MKLFLTTTSVVEDMNGIPFIKQERLEQGPNLGVSPDCKTSKVEANDCLNFKGKDILTVWLMAVEVTSNIVTTSSCRTLGE